MIVFVNNEEEKLTTGSSLHYLLKKRDLLEQKGIAIAVNNEVVSKAEWKLTILLPDDYNLL